MQISRFHLVGLAGLAFGLALHATFPAVAQIAPTPIVETASGPVLGEVKDGVEVFRALPYAKPPVGDLRWRQPEPPLSWTRVRQATTPGRICIQPPSTGIKGPQSEDCLTLDVFTATRTAAKPQPVLVWIHGGGFTGGTGITPEFDGAAFAKSGVVLVNINYRLGRLGFFAHPALTREAGGHPVADFGLMDQIAALKWVRANIRAFGGDPTQVTIAGGSAGGASVDALMISPQARGLFHRAIAQSGLGREHTLDLAGAEREGVDLAGRWGLAAADPKALRAIPIDRILAEATGNANNGILKGEYPIIDGRVMPSSTYDAFKAGREAPVPFIIGSMTSEVPSGLQPPLMKAKIPPFDKASPAIQAAYGDAKRYQDLLPSDVIFGTPAVELAALHARRAPTYVYRFGITADAVQKMFGAAVHGTEGPYVFLTFDASPIPIGPHQRELGRTVHDYWAAFIRTGNPNGNDRPVWPRFADNQIMSFTNAGPKPGPDPDAERFAVIGAALDASQTPFLTEPVAAPVRP